MASQNNGNKQDNTPDEEIFGIFSEVFNAMDISRADIAAEMYDWNLPPLPQSERDKLGSQEGLLMTKEVMAGVEIAQPQGAMLYKGRPVLVYLRDQFINSEKYNKEILNPFHICYCKSLQEAKRENRYENRYVLTYDTSGEFKVNLHVRDKYGSNIITQEKEQNVYRRLKVCQTCLHDINWKKFRKYDGPGLKWWQGGNKRARYAIIDNFDIKEFLHDARKKQFEPFAFGTDELSTSGATALKAYSLTSEMKQNLKDARENRCDSCHKVFPSRSLEIHHKNHNEGDNRRENLIVLCAACHTKLHKLEGGLRVEINENTAISDVEYADTQKRIGDMHMQGFGAEQNPQKAGEHYALAAEGYEAAEAGNVEAQMALAAILQGGLGLPADETAAKNWYKKVAAACSPLAEAGDTQGAYMMSLLHENGWGVGRSKDKAESYKKLAYEGYSKNEADLTPDELMRLSQLAEKEEEAADWKSRAAFIYDVMAKRGDAVAGYKLAKIIEEERDEADEVELPDTSESFEKAKQAFAQITGTYEDNQDVDKVALRARNGSEAAIITLGRLHSKGEAKALAALKELCKQGNKTAVGIIEKHANDGDMDAIMAMAEICMEKNIYDFA